MKVCSILTIVVSFMTAATQVHAVDMHSLKAKSGCRTVFTPEQVEAIVKLEGEFYDQPNKLLFHKIADLHSSIPSYDIYQNSYAHFLSNGLKFLITLNPYNRNYLIRPGTLRSQENINDFALEYDPSSFSLTSPIRLILGAKKLRLDFSHIKHSEDKIFTGQSGVILAIVLEWRGDGDKIKEAELYVSRDTGSFMIFPAYKDTKTLTKIHRARSFIKKLYLSAAGVSRPVGIAKWYGEEDILELDN